MGLIPAGPALVAAAAAFLYPSDSRMEKELEEAMGGSNDAIEAV